MELWSNQQDLTTDWAEQEKEWGVKNYVLRFCFANDWENCARHKGKLGVRHF